MTNLHSTSGAVRLDRRLLLLAASSLLPWTGRAVASTYPQRPVRIVVPFTPGGSVDSSIRLIALQLSQQMGTQFVVENRPGAGGQIGISAALEAPADGYTLLAVGNNISTAPALSKSVRFDPVTSFSYIARVAVDASSLSVGAASPFRSLPDIVAFAKANPGKLTYGSAGNGTPGHLAMEMLKRRADVQIRHIPYAGAAPAITDLLGGHTDMIMAGSAQQVPHVKGGRMRALASTTPERFFALPDVPSISEFFAGYQSITWLGLAARAGTPPEIVQQLSREIMRALSDPDVQKRYRDAGLRADYLAPDELARHVAAEAKTYGQLIKDVGITAD